MKIRLNKVQKELNLGLSTIVEFLQKKGFEIKEDPNAVVPEQGYNLLIEEFSADKKARIQSDNFTKERQNKEKPKATPAEPEKVSAPVEKAPEVAEKPAVVKPVPAEEAPVTETKIKVTGRIDLDALNRRTAKKEEPKPVAEEKPAPVEEPKKEESKPVAEVKPEPVEEPKKEEAA